MSMESMSSCNSSFSLSQICTESLRMQLETIIDNCHYGRCVLPLARPLHSEGLPNSIDGCDREQQEAEQSPPCFDWSLPFGKETGPSFSSSSAVRKSHDPDCVKQTSLPCSFGQMASGKPLSLLRKNFTQTKKYTAMLTVKPKRAWTSDDEIASTILYVILLTQQRLIVIYKCQGSFEWMLQRSNMK